jgi:hypothetical protein
MRIRYGANNGTSKFLDGFEFRLKASNQTERFEPLDLVTTDMLSKGSHLGSALESRIQELAAVLDYKIVLDDITHHVIKLRR